MASRVTVALLLAIAGATAGCDRGSPAAEQAASNTVTASGDEAVGGGAAAAATAPGTVDRSHKGEAAPTTGFTTLAGKPATLAQFRGKPVLVNLWATWCAPCVKEMPTLEASATTLGDRVRVIAVSQDMAPEKAKAFVAKGGFAAVTPFLDPALGLSLAYAANLPTTILYDAQGKEIWRVAGELDWTGAKARALLAEAG